jgi:hypothetical protein
MAMTDILGIKAYTMEAVYLPSLSEDQFKDLQNALDRDLSAPRDGIPLLADHEIRVYIHNLKKPRPLENISIACYISAWPV